MKKPSEVFNSIRFAKLDPKHDKGHKGGSTDDEEHYAVSEKEWDQQVAHAKKRAMQEAKEKTEYDYEGDMARGQLQSIINNAQRVHDMLKDNDNLPEWVQSKITLAEDYISTVANYMMSEIDEEVELQEGRPSQRHPLEGHEYHKKTNAELEYIAKDAHKAAEAMKSHNTTAENKYRDQANDSATVRYFRQKNGMPDWYKKKYGHMKEETQVDEAVSNDDKSSVALRALVAKKNLKNSEGKVKSVEFLTKMKNRVKSGESLKEDEQLDELSNELLGRYKKAAGEDASAADKAGDYKKGDKRFSGIVKATKKQFDNDMKKEETTPPFDPPYKTNKGVVTDKSGAKHGPMSMARNLAKQAMKKQAEKMPVKESLEESRKTDIVKEAFKKAKKKNDETFQSEPELGSSVVKADN